MLINFQMPTIVGIWTFISMINITSEILKVKTSLFFYEQLKYHAKLSWAWKKVLYPQALMYTTVLPTKSDSDVVFIYKVIRGFELIDHLCINPICRIGLICKWSLDSRTL